MIAFQVACVLPLVEVELSLVQMKVEAIHRASATSTALLETDNHSQAIGVPDLGQNQSLFNQVSLPRALRHGAAQEELPEMQAPAPAFGMPVALQTTAKLITAATASEHRDGGLGILIILMIVLVVMSSLIYLIITHDSRKGGGNDRRAVDGGLVGQRPSALSVPRQSQQEPGPPGSKSRPFASPESSRLVLDDPSDLPMIYPDLVMVGARTRLAIPAEPLSEQDFEIDVLGLSGIPLLTATLNSRSGKRTVQLALHTVGTLLAKITSGMQLLGADGAHFGTLSMDGSAQQVPSYVLRAPGGRVILTIIPGKDPYEMQMISQNAGGTTERAKVVRRPATRLPAEHFEVTAGPGVDAVLVVACFLGLVVFATPRSSEAKSGVFG